MAITKSQFSAYIKAFQFRELFNEMGWNNDRTRQAIILDEIPYNLTAIAEKSGFRIFICEPPIGDKLPDKLTRKKIEGKVTKLFQEHLIIFIDKHNQEQVWQLAVRKAGSPTKISETHFTLSKDPELLYQRASGLFFTLDEEEKVTIIDVTKRVAENFQQNNERVTKKFYESFKKEHAAFKEFIKGIDDQLNMDWYASLMLNRLMFCYFIQKKEFLDNNKNYLQDKLKACKEKKGKNQFYSFYRDFLLALFHKGLGAQEHNKNLEVEIGKIPYLNGGLFDEHKIEKDFTNIIIDDKAFEKLFDFFDQYEWHLDTRESASGKDINPDVIGYIFEKYINDRAQMGAYYTKEDITDYISKNCIIPWLFDEVKRQYPKAFVDDGWLWQMVKKSGDEYIYDAVKYGVPENGGLFDDLPEEIKKGFAPAFEKKVVDGKGPYLHELRKSWNKSAPSDIALPTEIYREVIERRKRCADIKTKIESGEIKEINDFITYNLNIRQFAQDVIETTDDAEFIRHFYKALSSITILDPTCGSGAFLFAAMNILELLYEACIQRMRSFVDVNGKSKHKFFEETLEKADAAEHPNLQYFIYKSIILNNLYGVDIMNEAVEIAKLRLFLKLVATVDADYRKPNLGLEPLPDVDFNIRAGNTLVGYATEKQLVDSLKSNLIDQLELPAIKEKSDIVARAFDDFKEKQLKGYADFEDFKKAKDDLNERLDKLRHELDILLHKQHYSSLKYDQWYATHQPFHWFAEFYEIINGQNGFDVVIGNPPYVEWSKRTATYNLNDYKTDDCNNLYAYTIERTLTIMSPLGRNGMVVPLSLTFSRDFMTLRKLLLESCGNFYHSNFDNIPDRIFTGAKDSDNTSKNNQQRVTIFILDRSNNKHIYSTGLMRWKSVERKYLFEGGFQYVDSTQSSTIESFPKFPTVQMRDYFVYLRKCGKPISTTFGKYGNKKLVIPKTASYYISAYEEEKERSQQMSITFNDAHSKNLAAMIINSNIFFMYWRVYGDSFHVTSGIIGGFYFPIDSINIPSDLTNKLFYSIKNCTVYKAYRGVNVPNVNLNLNLDLLVEIDEWILSLTSSKIQVDPLQFLKAKSNSFFVIDIPKVANFSKVEPYIRIAKDNNKEIDSGEDEG